MNTIAEMTPQEMQAEIERLRARLAKRGNLVMKVSDKGGVSVYGLQRFPVTFYQEQWERLLNAADEVKAFIAEHKGELKVKGE